MLMAVALGAKQWEDLKVGCPPQYLLHSSLWPNAVHSDQLLERALDMTWQQRWNIAILEGSLFDLSCDVHDELHVLSVRELQGDIHVTARTTTEQQRSRTETVCDPVVRISLVGDIIVGAIHSCSNDPNLRGKSRESR